MSVAEQSPQVVVLSTDRTKLINALNKTCGDAEQLGHLLGMMIKEKRKVLLRYLSRDFRGTMGGQRFFWTYLGSINLVSQSSCLLLPGPDVQYSSEKF